MSLPDEYLSIDTPENVAFDYEVAGIGSRFLAALVDSLLILILQIVISLALGLLADLFGAGDWWNEDSISAAWIVAIFGLISFAFFWGFYVFFEVVWNGQSPGKRWVGLRVIRTDGTPITLTESIVRNLVRLIDFMPAYYGFGVVTMFVNKQSRRLGDLAAGTLVVRDRPTVSVESLGDWQPVLGLSRRLLPDGGTGLPVERLTNQDLQMAEEFLRRRDTSFADRTTRLAIAGRIAGALRERMGLPADSLREVSDEDLIVQVVCGSG